MAEKVPEQPQCAALSLAGARVACTGKGEEGKGN